MRPLALFGPGDFAPWSRHVFERVTRGGPALILSFGVVPMGVQYVAQLRHMAADHLDGIGIPWLGLEATDAATLDAHEHLDLLQDAGFVYLQGGSSRYIIETMRISQFLREARRLRVPWVATSGGTMASGARAVDATTAPMWSGEGLGLRDATFAAHWDTFDKRFPGFADRYVMEATGHPLVALDEDTAVVDDGSNWTVFGGGSVHVRCGDAWRQFRAGDVFHL